MERRFDMSDFEQSLKDHADQFKMVPSARVWKGIYNSLHPGSKWPSFAVGIVLLITLVTIGNLNNKPFKAVNEAQTPFLSSEKTSSSEWMPEDNAIATTDPAKVELKKSVIEKKSIKETQSSHGINKPISSFQSVKKVDNKSLQASKNQEASKRTNTAISFSQSAEIVNKDGHKSVEKNGIALSNGLTQLKTLIERNENFSQTKSANKISLSDESSIFHSQDGSNSQDASNFTSANPENPFILSLATPITGELRDVEPISFIPFLSSPEKDLVKLTGSTNDVNLINENKPFNLKKAFRKKNKNTEWVFYVTPNITTVSFKHKTIHPSISSNSGSMVVLPGQPLPTIELNPNPRIGFEAGAGIKTLVAKNLNVVTGFNLNYSSYYNLSNVVHPTFATLELKDRNGTFTKNYITYFGNSQSEKNIKLTNYAFQLSVPIGFEYALLRNKKVEIGIQSVIEPSVVLLNHAYLLSSDGRYYVTDPTLTRRVNLGGNIGTFVTFSSFKIRWHIGPDIRYQFLSTYKNNYPSKEHFVDYGIRIGISKAK